MRLLQKILMVVAGFCLLVFVAVWAAAWQAGAFRPVQVDSAEQGPFFILTFPEPESPTHLPSQMDRIRSYLQQKGYSSDRPVGVYYRDPLSVSMDEVEASAGFLLRDSVAVDTPFILVSIPQQVFAIAAVRTNPILVPFKTYPALQAWMRRGAYRRVPHQPVLEFYYPDDRVEVKVPVTAIQYDSLAYE